MNILEQADKYAEGKANEAITKAIAEAYIEGYKAGYKDREEEIPLELRDNKTEYIDLGLPSRTLWSTDYEKLDGARLYLPYEKAEYLKIPTQEQWEELKNLCRWEYEFRSDSALYSAKCVGPNGNVLTFQRTGRKKTGGTEYDWQIYFWLEDDTDKAEKLGVNIYATINYSTRTGRIVNENIFSGYKLPVRLVR